MNQISPLLHYRLKCDTQGATLSNERNYDILSGLWLDTEGEPLIKKFINNISTDIKDETLLTKTREGIDRSEASCSVIDKNALQFNEQTLLTETRESIDRSEKADINDSYINNSNVFNIFCETSLTRTRESTDRTERVNEYIEPVLQTIQSHTREQIDRSETS